MARITIEDCLIEETNRFSLVRLAAKRAKQILLGSKPVTDSKGNRAIVTALREIAAGKVQFHKAPPAIVNPDLTNSDDDDSDLGMSFGIKDSDIFKEKEVVAAPTITETPSEETATAESEEVETVDTDSEEELH